MSSDERRSPSSPSAAIVAVKRHSLGKSGTRKNRMIRLERDGEVFEIRDRIPLLPLRDVVIFPYMTIPLLVGRIPSVNAIEAAVQKDRVLFVLAQRRPDVPDPVAKDLYRVGTLVRVLQLFVFPNGTMLGLVEAIYRTPAKKFCKGA